MSQQSSKKRQLATSPAICYVIFQFVDEKASTSSLSLSLGIFGIQIETRIMGTICHSAHSFITSETNDIENSRLTQSLCCCCRR